MCRSLLWPVSPASDPVQGSGGTEPRTGSHLLGYAVRRTLPGPRPRLWWFPPPRMAQTHPWTLDVGFSPEPPLGPRCGRSGAWGGRQGPGLGGRACQPPAAQSVKRSGRGGEGVNNELKCIFGFFRSGSRIWAKWSKTEQFPLILDSRSLVSGPFQGPQHKRHKR